MGLSTVFKNFGHAMATAAKYTVIGIKDIVMVANKSQAVAPGVELLIGAFAGPQAAKLSDLAFHALGDVANALEHVGTNLDAATAANGLNIQMDWATIQAIQGMIPVLKQVIASVGAQLPAVTK